MACPDYYDPPASYYMLCTSMNIMYVYFVYITNEMQGIRKTNEPDVSRRFHIG